MIAGRGDSPDHVVVLRALKLGDLLVSVPALRAIRRAWPAHEIMLAIQESLRPVVELTGSVDTLLPVSGLQPLPVRAHRPAVAINLHGVGPQSNTVLDALDPLRRIGHRGPGWHGPQWTNEVHERDRWCDLLRAHGVPADPTDLRLPHPPVASPAPGAVVVHPGAGYGSRRWPPERFAAVAADLAGRGHRVVITGSAEERPLAERVHRQAGLPGADLLAGRTGVLDLAALVAGARLVVSADTGIAHLAYAYATPSVTLFGPAPARQWGPPPGPHAALSVDRLRHGDPFTDHPDPALTAVTTDQVRAAAGALLGADPERMNPAVSGFPGVDEGRSSRVDERSM
jgi:ADP-heptose:LPS heptosyltransferase